MTIDQMAAQDALAELGRIKLGEVDLQGVLERVTELAKRTLVSATEVSVTLVRGKRAHTAAFTGPLAIDLDESQYERGYGPCLDASASGTTITISDFATETRWPDYAAAAQARGAGSSLSVGLPIQDAVVGALNIYATEPHAFDGAAVTELAEVFASYAAVALANANLYDSTATLAEQMREAMETRAVIEQAKGIVMGDRRCTPEEAFAILRKLSQDSNRKLRDVAVALVEQAATPRTR